MAKQYIRHLDKDGNLVFSNVKAVGELDNLKTTSKESVVEAINEIIDKLSIDNGVEEVRKALENIVNKFTNLSADYEELSIELGVDKQRLIEIGEELKNKLNDTEKTLQSKLDSSREQLQEEVKGIKEQIVANGKEVDGKIVAIQKDIVNTNDELSSKMSKAEFEDNVGLNTWTVSKFEAEKSYTNDYPTIEHIEGKTPTEIIDVKDSVSLFPYSNVQTSTLLHYFTNIKQVGAKSLQFSVTHNDGMAVLLNGAYIYYKAGSGTGNVSISLRAGWNTVELLIGVKGKIGKLNLSSKLSDNVDKLTSVIGVGDKNESRLQRAETNIKQTNESISLKADKTVVEDMGNSIDKHEGEIKVLNDEIASTVKQTVFDSYTGRLEETETIVRQTAKDITSLVNQSDFDTLNGKVNSVNTVVEQTAENIKSLATKSDVDAIKGTVSEVKGSIEAQAGQIELMATKDSLDTAKGEISSQLGVIKVEVDKISSKVDNTKFDELVGKVDKQGTSIDQLSDAITLTATKEELNTVTGQVGSISAQLGVQAEEISSKVSQSEVTEITSNAVRDKADKSNVYTKSETEGLVNNLQIGGRNLLLYSRGESSDANYWNGVTSATIDGYEAIRFERVGYTGDSRAFASSKALPTDRTLNLNGTYTLSGWFYIDTTGTAGDISSNSSNDFIIRLRRSSGNSTSTKDYKIVYGDIERDKWVYLSSTFNIGEFNYINQVSVNLYRNGLVYFRNLKLEEGNKATSWTPSIEDVDKSIENVQKNLEELNTTITTTFKDGIIEEAEAKAIQNQINIISTEKGRLDSTYNVIYANTNLVGTPKSNLKSKKDSYNTAYTNLINSINSAIADSKTTPTEKADVDSKFTAYKTALSNLSTELENATRAIETTIAKSAVDGLIIGGRNYFSLYGAVGNFVNNELTLDTYQSVGSFSQLYNLTTSMKEFVGKTLVLSFEVISPNGETPFTVYNSNGNPRYLASFTGIKSPINNAWTKQVITVNVADKGSSLTEKDSNKIEFYASAKTGVKIRNVKLEIGTKPTDFTLAPEDVDKSIETVQTNLNNLNTTITTTFKDGIIDEVEAKAISSNINSLSVEKSKTDSMYSSVYGNKNLTGTPKTDLLSKKTTYDTAYTNLINSINSAIKDGKTTTTEKADVDSKFTAYGTAVKNLQTSLENAGRNIEENVALITVNNLQIGGRNLMKGTKDFTDSWENINLWLSESEKYGDLKVYSRTSAWSGIGQILKLEKGFYTYSTNVRSSVDTQFNIYALISGGHALSSADYIATPANATYNSTTKWQRVNFTIEVKADGYYFIRPEITDKSTSGVRLYVSGMQLEKGTKATDYTPAPEDVTASISNVQTNLNNLNTTITTTFKDGIIEEAEAKAIQNQINLISTEKGRLDSTYNIIYANTNLVGTPKTNLKSKKDSYNTAYTNLINSINSAIADGKTTATEKADVDSKFTAYKTALSNLSTEIENATRSIESTVTQNAVNGLVIGGRNLVKGGSEHIIVADATTADAFVWSVMERTVNVEAGKAYTVSLYYNDKKMSSSEKGYVYAYAYDKDGKRADNNSDYMTSHSVPTKTMGSNVAYLKLFFGVKNYLKGDSYKMKIELGNKSTDWSLASEDVEAGINKVQKNLDELDTTINTTFKDGIIEEAEAKAIQNQLNLLNSEKVKFDSDYSSVYSNKNLTGTPKTGLASSKSAYDTAYTNLTTSINNAIKDGKTTTAEKTDVDSKFTTYRTAITNLTTALETANRAIETAVTQSAVNGLVLGGENLLRESGAYLEGQSLTYWRSNGGGISIDTTNIFEEYPTLRTKFPSGITYKDWIPVIAGEEYVYSAWIKADEALTISNQNLPLHIQGGRDKVNQNKLAHVKSNMSYTSTDVGKWKHIWAVVKPTSDANYFKLFVYNNNSTVEINVTNIKFEKGNKPTGWSISSKETINRLYNAESSISQTKDQISLKVNSTEVYTKKETEDYTANTISNIKLGKNLVQTVKGWEKGSTTLTTGAIQSKQDNANRMRYFDYPIPVKSGVTYSYQNDNMNYYLAIHELDKDLKLIKDSGWLSSQNVKYKTQSTTVYMRFVLRKSADGAIALSDVMNTRFSLVEGDVYQAWTQAPEDIENGIDEAVGNIEIGAKNLLMASQIPDFSTNNSSTSPIKKETMLKKDTGEKEDFVRITPTGEAKTLSLYRWFEGNLTVPYLEANTDYTISYMARSVGAKNRINTFVRDNASSGRFNSVTQYYDIEADRWTWLSHTFRATKDLTVAGRFLLNIASPDGKVPVDFKLFKLEKGNKGTDWTVASEETETRISSAEATISAHTNQISAKVTKNEVVETIRSTKIGSRNLFVMDDIYGANAKRSTDTNGFFVENAWATEVYRHAQLKKMLKPSTTYTVSYKFRLDTLSENTTAHTQNAHGVLNLYSGNSGYEGVVLNGTASTIDESNSWKVGSIVERRFTFKTPSKLHDADSNYRLLAYARRSMNGSTQVKVETGTFFDVQFEEGEVQTSWKPAIEDSDYTGGRNLLQGTADFSKGFNKFGDTENGIAQIGLENEILTYKVPSGGIASYNDLYTNTSTMILAGTDYVVSFWAKASKAGTFQCFFYSPNNTISSEINGVQNASADGNTNVTVSTEWKKYVIRFKQSLGSTSVKTLIIGRLMKANWLENDTVSISAIKLEEGTTPTAWTYAPEDTAKSIKELETRVSNAEILINEDKIVSTVMQSSSFVSEIDKKANGSELADKASKDYVDTSVGDSKKELVDEIDKKDSVYEKRFSAIEQSVGGFKFNIEQAGGINLAKNSIGFSEFNNWKKEGDVNNIKVIDNMGATELGDSKSFYFPKYGALSGVKQIINLEAGKNYTYSFKVKRTAVGSASDIYVRFYYLNASGTEVTLKQENIPAWASADIGKFIEYKGSFTIKDQAKETFVAIRTTTNAEPAYVTSLMVSEGTVHYKWSLAEGEVFNANVTIDSMGIKVANSTGKGYTQISTEEFAGYAEVDGQMKKVFTINDDVTEVTKIDVEKEINMKPIKLISVTGTRNGWAFVKST